MSGRGRPSKGCSKCRSSKCDEATPACQRCVKGSYNCIYRDGFELVLRNQTTATAHRAQQKWRSRAKKDGELDGSQASSPRSVSSPQSAWSGVSFTAIVPLSRVSIQPLVADLACHRFFYDYCILEEANGFGFYSYIAPFFWEAPAGSTLHTSVLAAAYANFGARCKSPEGRLKGIAYYTKALKLVTQAMSTPNHRQPLHTLIAITTLGIYEMITAPYMTPNGSWGAHAEGAAALLHSKFLQSYEKPAQALIFHSVFFEMLVNKLNHKSHPSIPLETRSLFLEPNSPPHIFLELIHHAATICADWHTLEPTLTGAHSPKLSALITSALAVDARYALFGTFSAFFWHYEPTPVSPEECGAWLRPLLEHPGAPEKVHRFVNMDLAFKWNFLDTARLFLNRILLRALDVELAYVTSATSPVSQASLASLSSGSPSPDSPPTSGSPLSPLPWDPPAGSQAALYPMSPMSPQALLIARQGTRRRLRTLVDAICAATLPHFVSPLRGQDAPREVADMPSMRGYVPIWPLWCAGMCMKEDGIEGLEMDGKGAARLEWMKAVMRVVRDEFGVSKAEAFLGELSQEGGG
ncbi:hypothetical protein EJ06DRAFT_519213 [Trichodelitschia bisporula]|uniref:Zn(2)-C6 fungal-type domain-containing protein n=1 Tax=Trichodelitschia bisporula TaxID=703511 RepID=A0A6G1I509_9PEZI|nr:hypothetical protein EJ06DRAFT_519213 [Trichodelitschia bisporula]